jgi:hypothetical protein
MLNKASLSVRAISEKEPIHGVFVSPYYTAATDGCVLGVVSRPKPLAEDFPKPSEGEILKKFEPFLISPESARAIEKQIPKSRTVPLLQHAVLVGESEDEVVVFTTGDEGQMTSRHPKKSGLKLTPKTIRSATRKSREEVRFSLDVRRLEAVLGVVKAVHGPDAEIAVSVMERVGQFDLPIRIRGRRGAGRRNDQKTFFRLMPLGDKKLREPFFFFSY